MKKSNHIAQKLARRSRLSQAVAAEQLDQVVHEILRDLKRGKSAPLPGLGTFEPGKQPKFRFDESERKDR